VTTYFARRTPVHQGVAAWNAILGPQGKASPLDRDITADFCVVGAGFAGLSAARRLRQLLPEARIAVLEAGRVAEGAAGRNSGFMIDLPHDLASEDYAGDGDDALLTRLNRKAIAFGAKAVADYRINDDYFDSAGKVNGAAGSTGHRHNISYAAHLASLGEPHELLDAQQMTELTGSQHYVSGLYTPGTVMLQPAGYIRGLTSGLRKQGVEIYENSAVVSFEKQGTDWQVATARGRVSASRIILAVNGHLESFGVAKGRLMHLFLFAMMSKELDSEARARLGGAERWAVTPSDPMGTTMRRIDAGQGGHRIVTRSCAVLRSGMQSNSSDIKQASRVMKRKFDQRFPQLSGLKMDHVWAGHLCLSRNGVAVAKEIETGVFSACVQNGLGTARGTLTGIAAAETAARYTSEITEFFLSESWPKRLPPRPIRDIGANAILRWRGFLARNE